MTKLSSRGWLPLSLILIVPFVVQTVAAVGLVGWLSWRSGRRAVNILVEDLSDELSARVYQRLSDHIESAETVVQLNIDALKMDVIDLEQQAIASDYIFQQLKRFPQLTGITLVTDSPPNYVGIAETTEGTQVLTLWDFSYGGIANFALNERGEIERQTDVNRDYDHRQRPWYMNPVAARRAQWQAPYLTVDPIRLTISIDQPFYNRDGDLIGVSDAELSLASLSSFLNTLKVGKTGQVFVVENSGELIATSSGELPYRLDSQSAVPKRLAAKDSDDPRVAGAATLLQKRFENLSKVRGRQRFSFLLDEEKQLMQVMPFYLEGGAEWLIVVTVPESDFMDEIHRNRLTTTLLCGLALLVVVGLGLAMTCWLARPVQRLSLAAQGLAEGQWQSPVQPSRVSELDGLAQSFNRMANQLQVSFQALEYSAHHDGLTGLLNRRGFQEALSKVIADGRDRDGTLRGDWAFALFFLDIDNFQRINDSFGHLAGDQLLESVATRLRRIAKPNALPFESVTFTVARFGGDEFCLLVEPILTVEQASAAAEEVLACFYAPFKLANREFFIDASMGLALSKVSSDDAESLMRNADIALYAAKRAGKSQCKVFDDQMYAIALDKFQLATDLHKAFQERAFTLCYQPIVDANTQEIIGFEALIRWTHPERGAVSPSVFIPIAEESELISEIGWWVMETACQQMQTWLRHDDSFRRPELVTVSINFSSKQFLAADCLERMSAILSATGIAPHHVKLEITEGLFMHADDAMVAKLQRFRDLGMQLSVDDFGTGYSSLSYLYRFPITDIKIDRAFLEHLPEDRSRTAIVEAIILLGKKLDLNLIAEGVETIEQLSWLQKQGIDQIQGLLFYRPLTVDALTSLLSKS